MAGPMSCTSSGIDPAVLASNSGGGLGVWGASDSGNGILGSSNTGTGVIGESASGNAGQFKGKVDITGDLSVGANAMVTGNAAVTGNLTANDVLLSGKDCAEEFESGASHEPGSVVVFDERGAVVETETAYNICVAGVIAGRRPRCRRCSRCEGASRSNRPRLLQS